MNILALFILAIYLPRNSLTIHTPYQKSQEYYQSKGGQMPVRWTAPEALEQR